MPDAREWLSQKHPVFEAQRGRWEKNERRLRGGDGVLSELRPYEWEYERPEDTDGDIDSVLAASNRGRTTKHYEHRKDEATYVNFPDMFATAMTGFLLRHAPSVDADLSFGALGSVLGENREGNVARPSAAELVYYNVDAVGGAGSQWDPWWMALARRAMATGHRWVLCDAPAEVATSERDWERGLRPYLVEYSPLSVPMWHFDGGRLAFAIVRDYRPAPRLENGSLAGLDPSEKHHLLLVREGFEGLGEEYAGGGWWLFGPDRRPVGNGDGEQASGTWESTDGEIPMFAHYYDRGGGTGLDGEGSLSRPGVTELGQLAVSYMNLTSAWDFDVWDAAGSIQLLLGVTQDAFNIMTGLLSRGSKMAPVPKDDETGAVPDVYDASGGAVSSEVFSARLANKRDVAKSLASMESVGTPSSSGESKRVGFANLRSPRLALMASELEQSQNTAIRFLEQRFGFDEPSGRVNWEREFDLTDVVDEIRELFTLESLAGVRSTTSAVTGLVKAIKERGIVSDTETLEEIATQYRVSAESRDARRTRERSLIDEFGA